MLDATLNMRDKALISLLYDSGCRISELLTMDRKDLGFDQYGAKITVSGKTGVRAVRIVGGFRHLSPGLAKGAS
jgi:site-specific recombinase XerC